MADGEKIKGSRRSLAGMAAKGGTRLARRTLGRRMKIAGVSASDIGDTLSGKRSLTGLAVAAIATRLATRSVPGALVVGGGLVAKALLERRKQRKAAARKAKSSED
jgi:hypothetical protein